MVGFREAVGSIFKVAKVTDVDENSRSDSLGRHIQREARSHNSPKYGLSVFNQEYMMNSTKSTLHKMVSDLVPDGVVCKYLGALANPLQAISQEP